ncbi:MAG: nuclear transport factor 2 family protein [Amphiplicatus sp.]
MTPNHKFFRRLPAAAAAILGLFSSNAAAEFKSPMQSEKASETENRNKALIAESFAAWAAGTGGPYDLLAEDASWTIVGNTLASKTYPSREAFMSEVIRPFNARMRTGLKPHIRNIYAEGGAVIVFFDASGEARDGQTYANTYAWFLDLKDGKIVRSHAFFDAVVFNDFWTRIAP